MKKHVVLAAFLTLFLSSSLSADCKAPRRGPPGPAGAEGPAGPAGPAGTLTSVYASSYTSGAQSAGSPNYPINFLLEQVAPKGITHPVGGDFSKYQIITPGIYEVAWNINLLSLTNFNDIALYLSKNGSLMPPAPLGRVVLFQSEYQNLAGQTLILLAASDVIQLIVDGEPADTIIEPSSFTLTLIAPVP